MASLKDIARKVGVNVSTVSRALNNHPDIAEETRRRIQKIAAEMRYTPNTAAQTLAGKASRLIGILVPEIVSNYFATMLHYLEDSLCKEGYSPIIAITGFELGREIEALEMFCNRPVDGIMVICSIHKEIEKYLNKVKNVHNIPVVLLEALLHFDDYDYVMIDDTYGMSIAIKYLIQKGHQKIGFITEKLNYPIRYPMFQEAMRSNGLTANPKYIQTSGERFEMGGYLAMKSLIKQEDRPTALLAGYDDIAIGVMRAVYESDLQIPQDFAIIGNDNIREASFLYQGLTTISPPLIEMSQTGADLLLKKIQHSENKVIHNIKLKPELIIRETT